MWITRGRCSRRDNYQGVERSLFLINVSESYGRAIARLMLLDFGIGDQTDIWAQENSQIHKCIDVRGQLSCNHACMERALYGGR